jgi:hypothetical protein
MSFSISSARWTGTTDTLPVSLRTGNDLANYRT